MSNTSDTPKKTREPNEYHIIVVYLLLGVVLYFIASSLPITWRRVFLIAAPSVMVVIMYGIMFWGVKKGTRGLNKETKKAELYDQHYDTGWHASAGVSTRGRAGVGMARHAGKIKIGKAVSFEMTIESGPWLGIGAIMATIYWIIGVFWLIKTF